MPKIAIDFLNIKVAFIIASKVDWSILMISLKIIVLADLYSYLSPFHPTLSLLLEFNLNHTMHWTFDFNQHHPLHFLQYLTLHHIPIIRIVNLQDIHFRFAHCLIDYQYLPHHLKYLLIESHQCSNLIRQPSNSILLNGISKAINDSFIVPKHHSLQLQFHYYFIHLHLNHHHHH